MKENYQKRMEELIAALPAGAGKPGLLLHSCCAPCSSYVLSVLVKHFTVTVLYYNPNIDREPEYLHRLSEQKRYIAEVHPEVQVLEAAYDPESFETRIIGLTQEPEGGARCMECFRLRLEKTKEIAVQQGFPFFTTTLSVSPHKNAQILNAIGASLETDAVRWLYADFKKKEGYKQSVQLAKDYGLYRQVYCGCKYSQQN